MIKQDHILKENDNLNLTKKIQYDFFSLEPLVNKLEDPNPSMRLLGLKQLNELNTYNTVKKLRNLSFDLSYEIQQEAMNKLKPIEMYYRRKFSYYQNHPTGKRNR